MAPPATTTMEDTPNHVTPSSNGTMTSSERRFAYLMSEELEREIRAGLSDNPARTVVSPLTLPTELSTVLLTSNPWEEREMQRKLKSIKDERKRRLLAIEWNQRAFFISQVFDHEQKLRYCHTKPDPYRNRLMNEPRSALPQSSAAASKHSTSFYATHYGMFAPPLDYQRQFPAATTAASSPAKDSTAANTATPGRRKLASENPHRDTLLPPIDSLTQYNATASTDATATGTRDSLLPQEPLDSSDPNQAIDIVSQLNSEATDSRTLLPPLVEDPEGECASEVHTPHNAHAHAHTAGARRQSLPTRDSQRGADSPTQDHTRASRTPLCRSTSLPLLPVDIAICDIDGEEGGSDAKTGTNMAATVDDAGLRTSHSNSKGARQKHSVEHQHSKQAKQQQSSTVELPVLCDAKVITKLTNMLTPQLMMKATDSVTQLVKKQQRKMIKANRAVIERRTILDPRFHNLEKILEDDEKPALKI